MTSRCIIGYKIHLQPVSVCVCESTSIKKTFTRYKKKGLKTWKTLPPYFTFLVLYFCVRLGKRLQLLPNCADVQARPDQTRPDLSRASKKKLSAFCMATREAALIAGQHDFRFRFVCLCVSPCPCVWDGASKWNQFKAFYESLLLLNCPFLGININASSSSSSSAHCHFHSYSHSHCHSHHHCHCRPSACPAKPVWKKLPISFSFEICQNANPFGSVSPGSNSWSIKWYFRVLLCILYMANNSEYNCSAH